MIEKTILTLLKQNKTVALVTIIAGSGSAPRLPGSKMVVEQDGTLHGTIGGGKMEYSLLKTAKKIAAGADPLLEEIDLRGIGADNDMDMVCGGVQVVLIERIIPKMLPLFQQAANCYKNGAQGVWKVDISEPKNPQRSFIDLRLDHPEEEQIELNTTLRRRVTQLIQHENQKFVLDPLPKNGTVILFGGGHVALEVAELAATLDFKVIVLDDRIEFADKSRFPMAASVHHVDFMNAFCNIDQTEELYLLILTHGHRYDQEVLAQALQTRARYIGMIGSRRKRDIIYENLRQQGCTDADFAGVHCPVGLSIGSETPREIAVSIIAELIAARAGAL